MPFCDSASTQASAVTRMRSSRLDVDVLDDDLDGVRHLLERAPQDLLADELGEHDRLRLVGDVVGLEHELALGQQAAEVLDERVDARALARGDREDVVGDLELGRRLEHRDDVGVVDAVDLVDRDDDRHLGSLERAGDEPVAGADALLGVEQEQRGVGVAHLALDARLHALGQRVARALDARQVDEHELRVAAHGDAADRAARRLRLVGDDRDLLPDDRVDERRLADVRASGERDEPRPGAHG